MLVKLLNELQEYNNIVIALNHQNHFTEEEFSTANYYCLQMGAFSRFPFAALKLRRFIKKNKIDLVHSHLFTATLVARLGVPKNIPLVTTIHTDVAASGEYKRWHIRLLEKAGYNFHKSTIIGVSKTVLQNYFTHFKHTPGRTELLYTFADNTDSDVLKERKIKDPGSPFTLIAIGALRYPKNQQYLIKAFQKLKEDNVELHIYGTGRQAAELQQLVADTGVRVVLKGEVKGASRLLPQYDAYVMSSEFEGFSLSVLEAMNMEIPMLLSDIPSFREQCADTALFFNLADTDDFVRQLRRLMASMALGDQMAAAGKQRVINNFTMQHHLQGLRAIYNQILSANN